MQLMRTLRSQYRWQMKFRAIVVGLVVLVALVGTEYFAQYRSTFHFFSSPCTSYHPNSIFILKLLMRRESSTVIIVNIFYKSVFLHFEFSEMMRKGVFLYDKKDYKQTSSLRSWSICEHLFRSEYGVAGMSGLKQDSGWGHAFQHRATLMTGE